jgi:hypothetical protein
VCPVHADFGKFIAAVAPAKLLVDQLAETVEEAALQVFDAECLKVVMDAYFRELAHGMGQQCDASAYLLNFRR